MSGERALPIVKARLETLRMAIVARDWEAVEFQFDRVSSALAPSGAPRVPGTPVALLSYRTPGPDRTGGIWWVLVGTRPGPPSRGATRDPRDIPGPSGPWHPRGLVRR